MKALSRLLATLGINAVPAIGWFFEGWSSGTTLAIYWFENVVASLFVAAQIALHRRAVPCRGHGRYEVRKDAKRGPAGSFLAHYLTVALTFSAGHGIFLAALVFVLTKNGRGAEVGLDWHSLAVGSALMLGFLIVGFLADLPGLSRRPFLWIERKAERSLFRVIIVHMTLIFGLMAVAFTGATKALFAVFVGLKTLNDLSGILPQWDPPEAPAWLCRIMDKVPSAHPGEKFADFWKRDKREELQRRAANERLLE